MAWSQDDLEAIDAAIASGAKSVRYSDGSEVQYRDLADMKSIRAEIAAALTPAAKPHRAFLGSPRSGY